MNKSALFMCLAFIFAVCGSTVNADTPTAAPAVITSLSTSDSKFHVFPPNQPFSFTLSYVGSGVDGYQWVDWTGKPIGKPVAVDGLSFTVASPEGTAITAGYYGLRLLPEGTVIQPGGRKELGFAALPMFTEPTTPDWYFGMVHAGMDDPYVHFAWTKTTWSQPWWKWDDKTGSGVFDGNGWKASGQAVLDTGKTDLPVVVSPPWGTSPANASGISALASAIYRATPDLPAAEWGVEEAHSGWDEPTADKFFDNLAIELKAVRDSANANGAGKTLLVQQIEGVSSTEPDKIPGIESFFKSPALQYVDVLSLHPYAWPDFKSPDIWLGAYLQAVQKARSESAKPNLPIWFTEIGCVTDDAQLGSSNMLDGGHPISGISRADGSKYIVKAHIIAFANDVSRIYWYRYQDWTDSPSDAEEHFGMRDVWGYPRPTYAAYANMVNCIGSKKFVNARKLSVGATVYEFAGKAGACFVVWEPAQSGATELLSLSRIAPKIKSWKVTNLMGAPVEPVNGSVTVDDSPLFITASR